MKLSEILDAAAWYFWDKPRDVYKTIRHWWICNGKNPYHWKLIWFTIFHHYGWDNSFNWEVIQLMILKSKYYFETHHYTSDKKRAEIIRWQTVAIGLLDIILEKRNLWRWNYDAGKYECLVRVNLKNKDRFAYRWTDYETGKIGKSTKPFEINPHELLREKAEMLLTRILYEHSDEWWD